MDYVTFTNAGSLELCRNFLVSAINVGIDENNLIVYCLDKKTYDVLDSEFNCQLNMFGDEIEEEYSSYGTDEFKIIMMKKLKIILEELKTKKSFIYSDSDIVFLKNPTDTIKEIVNIISEDTNLNAIFATDAIPPQDELKTICAGFVYIRNIEGTQELFEKAWEVCDQHMKDPSRHETDPYGDYCDQQVIRSLLSVGAVPNFIYSTFHMELVKNGNQFFPDPGPGRSGNEFVVHANFRPGVERKIKDMKEQGVWFLKEEVSS